MKYIFLTAIMFLSFSALHAQQSISAGSSKTITVAEANALNGTAQPTINGVPYSQYKERQDALKAEREQQMKAAAAAKPVPVLIAEPKKEEPVAQPKQKVTDPNIFN